MIDGYQPYAGLKVRALAFMFDYLIILLYLVGMTLAMLGINFAFPQLQQTLFGNPVSGQISGFFLVTLPISLYFALSEASARRATWGKQKKRLQVVDKAGRRLNVPRSLGRTLLKFIPWELAHTCIWQVSFAPQEPSPLITIGFILVWMLVGVNLFSILLSKNHQALYDRLAGTYVVAAGEQA